MNKTQMQNTGDTTNQTNKNVKTKKQKQQQKSTQQTNKPYLKNAKPKQTKININK